MDLSFGKDLRWTNQPLKSSSLEKEEKEGDEEEEEEGAEEEKEEK